MKGRLRLSFPRPLGEQQKALDAAMSFLTPNALKVGRASHIFKDDETGDPLFDVSLIRPQDVEFQHMKGFPRSIADQMVRAYTTQVAKIAYAMEHPEASLQWVEGEGFRLSGPGEVDEEVLFILARDEVQP